MKELSATEAARRFSEVLDEVEHKRESFVVRRHGRPIARIEPTASATWGDVLRLLHDRPVDPDFAKDVEEVRSLLTLEDRWTD